MTPRDPINTNFEAIGFESMYSIINLSTILILIIIFPSLSALELLLRSMKCKYPVKMRHKLNRLLYWNASIRFFRESFVMALMCAAINLKAFTSGTVSETLSSFLAILIILLAIIVPISLSVVIWRNFYRLDEQEVKDKFGAAYDQQRLKQDNMLEYHEILDTGNKTKLTRKLGFSFYMIFYYLRRILLVFTLIYLQVLGL